MLKPVTNWSVLQHALEVRRKQILLCAECQHIYLSKIEDGLPNRCPQCRVGAESEKHDRVGRPSLSGV